MNERPISTDNATTDNVTFEVTDNASAERFELHRSGELVSFAIYVLGDGLVRVPHVETIPEHRGHGYAARLMDGLLDIIRSEGTRIVPSCSFAAQHVRGNPDYHDLLG